MTVHYFTFSRKGEVKDHTVTVSVSVFPPITAKAAAKFAVRRACTALGLVRARDIDLVELSDEALLARLVAEQDRYTEGGLAWCVVQGQIDSLSWHGRTQ